MPDWCGVTNLRTMQNLGAIPIQTTKAAASPRSRRYYLLAALGLILFTASTRLPALVHRRAIDDEAIYTVVADEIVAGGRPYIDAVERKPPLLFWTYAAIFRVAGKSNCEALHAVALLWTLLTMAGLYVIGTELFDRDTGLIAALFYSAFQAWGDFRNLAFNGELLMNLPIVWAWAIAFRRTSSPVRLDLLGAGALLCAGFLLKQPAAIAAVPLGIYLLLPAYRGSRGLKPANSFVHAAMLTTGFFGLLLGVVLVLHGQGILPDAYYWTIAAHAIRHVFWTKGILITLAFVGICLPLVIGAGMAFRDRQHVWQGKAAERAALFGLLAASVVGVLAGTRFYVHYYIQLLPPLALLAAAQYTALWQRTEQPRWWLLRARTVFFWVLFAAVAFLITDWFQLGTLAPSAAGQYIRHHSAANDRIFVWGQHPDIYLDAQRLPASRYVATFPLTGYQFGGDQQDADAKDWIVPGAWSKLKEDFAKHPPAFIVDTGPDASDPYSVEKFPVLRKLLAQWYRPVASTADGLVYQRRNAK
jgi:Dolichyl-phosphate-mannose-protein mannosyltransferase